MSTSAEKLTDEQLDQPIVLDVDPNDGVRQSIRTLLSRPIGQMGMWNAALATRDYDWSVEGPTYLPRPRRRRRPVRAGRGLHLRRDDRARADVRGPRRNLVVLAFGRPGVEDLGWGGPMVWVAQPRVARVTRPE